MIVLRRSTIRTIVFGGLLALLGACGGEDGNGSQPSSPTPGGGGGTSSANRAPSISGVPATSATAGETYRFLPAATDPDGDSLTFSIDNKPDWATFDASTGLLTGDPGAADVGTYAAIRITVSDGAATTALDPFDVTVEAIGTSQVTLSWTAPTQNADGSPLTNLAGYNIYYGQSPNNLSFVRRVGVGMTSVVIENLTAGIWYFSMTSINSANAESIRTEPVSKRV